MDPEKISMGMSFNSLLNSNTKPGYVCVPYQHDKFSIDVKEMWSSSRNIKSIYFVTATFSEECKPYFPFSTNHYLLAKFEDEEKLVKDSAKFTDTKPTFVFTVDNELFERNIEAEPETDKTEKLADLGEDKTDIEDQKETAVIQTDKPDQSEIVEEDETLD